MKIKIVFFILFVCSTHIFAGDTSSVTTAKNTIENLLRIRSVSGKEKPAGIYLLETAKNFGLDTRIFTEEDSAFNFCASLFPLSSGKPNIVFLCHIDVVPAADSAEWRYPPFSGKLINDTVWGRGCLDMKGIGVMQMMAVKSFADDPKKNDLPYNVSVLFVSGEETGGNTGSKIITENYLKELNPFVVIGEGGAGLKNILPSKPEKEIFFISVAEKKSLWLKLSVSSHSHGHASVPSSETANNIMFKAMARIANDRPIIIFDKTTKKMFHELGRMNGGFKGFVLRHINSFFIRPFRKKILSNEPLLLSVVTNTSQLTNFYNPKGPPNVIPGSAEVYYDCRLLPGVKQRKFLRKLKLRIHDPRVKIEIVDESPDEIATEQGASFNAIANALKKTYPGSEVLPVLFPATTDNGYFRAKGISTFGILPLELSQSLIESVHGVNECMPVSSLVRGIDGYIQFINELMRVVK